MEEKLFPMFDLIELKIIKKLKKIKYTSASRVQCVVWIYICDCFLRLQNVVNLQLQTCTIRQHLQQFIFFEIFNLKSHKKSGLWTLRKHWQPSLYTATWTRWKKPFLCCKRAMKWKFITLAEVHLFGVLFLQICTDLFEKFLINL